MDDFKEYDSILCSVDIEKTKKFLRGLSETCFEKMVRENYEEPSALASIFTGKDTASQVTSRNDKGCRGSKQLENKEQQVDNGQFVFDRKTEMRKKGHSVVECLTTEQRSRLRSKIRKTFTLGDEAKQDYGSFQCITNSFNSRIQATCDTRLGGRLKRNSIPFCPNTTLPLKIKLERDEDGDTDLHLLIAKQSESVLQIIQHLPLGHDEIDAVNKRGQTPLHVAMYMNVENELILKIIKALLLKGANDKLVDDNGNTPLHIACVQGNVEKVRLLLSINNDNRRFQRNGYINELNAAGLSAFHLACNLQNLELMKLLYSNCADINQRDGLSGKTSLIRALEDALDHPNKRLDTLIFVEKLIKDFNVSVTIDSYDKNTALHYACLLNSKVIVTLLLEKGSSVGLKNLEKKTEKDYTTDKEIKDLLERKLRKKRRERNKHNEEES